MPTGHPWGTRFEKQFSSMHTVTLQSYKKQCCTAHGLPFRGLFKNINPRKPTITMLQRIVVNAMDLWPLIMAGLEPTFFWSVAGAIITVPRHRRDSMCRFKELSFGRNIKNLLYVIIKHLLSECSSRHKTKCHFWLPLVFPTLKPYKVPRIRSYDWPWRRGVVVIASASRTEDPVFESRQGARF
jgi:hypothetical protein